MHIPPSLSVPKRKRPNPNWGRPIPHTAAMATEFEQLVRRLHLSKGMYTSHELYDWCKRNRNRVYIPEWLLTEWNLTVDVTFSTAA